MDITLAGLFWSLGGEDDVIGKCLKKILYVGAFALILNSFPTLTDIIFRSFAGLGLTAGGSAIGPQDLLLPGRLAGTGFEATWPLLEQAKELVGRSEEHTSELQSLMRISYAVFCLKKKKRLPSYKLNHNRRIQMLMWVYISRMVTTRYVTTWIC